MQLLISNYQIKNLVLTRDIGTYSISVHHVYKVPDYNNNFINYNDTSLEKAQKIRPIVGARSWKLAFFSKRPLERHVRGVENGCAVRVVGGCS